MSHVEHDKWDNIIVHVGTNNLKEGNSMKITDKLDECLTYIQARNPDCQVAYSSIFKLSQGITKGESPYFRNFWDIFGNMRLVLLKMTSHLTSHNFQILKIEIFSKLCKI